MRPVFNSADSFDELNKKMFQKVCEILKNATYKLDTVDDNGNAKQVEHRFYGDTTVDIQVGYSLSGSHIIGNIGNLSTGMEVTALAITSGINQIIAEAFREAHDELAEQHNATLNAIKGFETSYNTFIGSIQTMMTALSATALSAGAVPVTNATLMGFLTPLTTAQFSVETSIW